MSAVVVGEAGAGADGSGHFAAVVAQDGVPVSGDLVVGEAEQA